MLKRHMTPLGRRGSTVAHKGKGSQATAMQDRAGLFPGAQPTMNDYAKATPMAKGVQSDDNAGGPPGSPWPSM